MSKSGLLLCAVVLVLSACGDRRNRGATPPTVVGPDMSVSDSAMTDRGDDVEPSMDMGEAEIDMGHVEVGMGNEARDMSHVELDMGPPLIDLGMDLGRPDLGPPDMGRDFGVSDPCVVELGDDNASTVGCNGGILGPDVSPNDFGGECSWSGSGLPGSCNDPTAQCSSGSYICLVPCTPADDYISRSDCPAGSRCFSFSSTTAWCYPDCNSAFDCAAGGCDSDGSCNGWE